MGEAALVASTRRRRATITVGGLSAGLPAAGTAAPAGRRAGTTLTLPRGQAGATIDSGIALPGDGAPTQMFQCGVGARSS
eukprot:2790522-Pyramimonas_sp.AAC.1